MRVGRIGMGEKGFWAYDGNRTAIGYPTATKARIATRKMSNEEWGKLPRAKGYRNVRW